MDRTISYKYEHDRDVYFILPKYCDGKIHVVRGRVVAILASIDKLYTWVEYEVHYFDEEHGEVCIDRKNEDALFGIVTDALREAERLRGDTASLKDAVIDFWDKAPTPITPYAEHAKRAKQENQD